MCEHNGQLRLEKRGIDPFSGAYDVTGYCPDCDEIMWHGIRYDGKPDIEYTFVYPAWHGKMMIQAQEQIQELMAMVADNARKRADLEAEYREKYNHATQERETAENTAINRLRLLTSMRIRLVEISTDLARAGDDDHRGKNAAILRVLASLLSMSRWKSSNEAYTSPDDGDVPF